MSSDNTAGPPKGLVSAYQLMVMTGCSNEDIAFLVNEGLVCKVNYRSQTYYRLTTAGLCRLETEERK